MKLFSFVFYDIKRLFGHGNTAILAMLSPIPILLLFAVFLAPMLSAGNGVCVSCAVLSQEENEVFTKLMDLAVSAEVKQGTAVIYPVKEEETGKRMVEEGKVAAFMYIPDHVYSDSMAGNKAQMEYYYSKEHAFEAKIFHASVNSTLSVFGQGIRMVFLAADIAKKYGLTDDDVARLWNEGTEDLIRIHLNRGRIIGKSGVFTPGGDYLLRYAMAVLFAVCAYFVSFPVMYLTGLDVSDRLRKRNIPVKNTIRYYFARLFAGTILILCSFLIMYPVARAIRRIHLNMALSVLPALLLTALVFSALAIMFGSIFKNAHVSLWAGLYFGAASIAGVTFLSDKASLNPVISFLSGISPFRACVSIFSNAMFSFVPERYLQDMLILFLALLLFATVGFVFYVKRGCKA